MAIKKAFEPLVNFLTENQDKKVKSVLQEIIDLCSAKGAGGTATTVRKDDAGNVTHIYDYYFKLWLPVSHVEFGKKEGSASGFNTMCKEGVSNWSKQQRDFKAAKEALLDDVASGSIQPSDIAAKLEVLEQARTRVIPFSIEGVGAADLEVAVAQTAEQLDALVSAYNARLAAEAQAKLDAAAQLAAQPAV